MQYNFKRIFINVLIVFLLLSIIVYVLQESPSITHPRYIKYPIKSTNATENFNVWCIFTRADKNYRLRENLRRFVKSLWSLSSIHITLNVISDNSSRPIADQIFLGVQPFVITPYTVQYHNVTEIAESLSDIVQIMQHHFSSQPGSYYSDVLFFLSIGLHRITSQSHAVMIDIDTEFKVDISGLFDEFYKMPPTALVAAAPELSPVYRHTLHMYRASNRNSTFGNPLLSGGNPGINSGVLLLNFAKQRQSPLYQSLLSKNSVTKLCAKYQFQGHLGDQDWYTLVSQEHPEVIHFLDCTWNRQLCLWWRHHGYHDIFDQFNYCSGQVRIYHGNCNTEIPSR